MQPRIYTYKITFEEVPYYYYGSKKERYYNQPYMGSPVANKWAWEYYTPKKQILELFDYTDEGYEECRKIEDRLIKPVLNDPWCLNERCGGFYSLKHMRDGGRRLFLEKRGIHSLSPEQRKKNAINARKYVSKETLSKGGKSSVEKMRKTKTGFFSITKEERAKIGRKSGKINGPKLYESSKGLFGMSDEAKKKAQSNGGKISGNLNKKLKRGICGLTKEQRRENAKKQNSTRWKCLVTGHISTYSALSRFQNNRGIDKNMRVMIE